MLNQSSDFKMSYIDSSLILLEINKTIEDIPKNMTIPSMTLDDVMNEGIFFSKAFEVPRMNPQIMVNSDRLMLFPTSLLVDNIADASYKSFWSTCVNTKRLFGEENIPCPIP